MSFNLTRTNLEKVSIKTFYESKGLCVHHPFASPNIPFSEEFFDQYFAVSHLATGCLAVGVIDGLATAIACCEFLIEEAAEIGINWSELTTMEEIASHPKRQELYLIKEEATNCFTPAWQRAIVEVRLEPTAKL